MIQYQQDFEKLFRQELEKVQFPKGKIDEDVRYYMPMIITTMPPQRLNCDLKAYGALVDEINADAENFNLYDISFILNAFDAIPAVDFDLKPTEYVELLEEVKKMSAVWNEMVKPIRKRVEERMQTTKSIIGKNNPLRLS